MYAGSNVLGEVAWYYWGFATSNSNSLHEAQPVGTKKANTLGLYDMTGLSFEWCLDRVTLSSGEYNNPSGLWTHCRGGTCYTNYNKSSLYVFGESPSELGSSNDSKICTIRVAQNTQ